MPARAALACLGTYCKYLLERSGRRYSQNGQAAKPRQSWDHQLNRKAWSRRISKSQRAIDCSPSCSSALTARSDAFLVLLRVAMPSSSPLRFCLLLLLLAASANRVSSLLSLLLSTDYFTYSYLLFLPPPGSRLSRLLSPPLSRSYILRLLSLVHTRQPLTRVDASTHWQPYLPTYLPT